METASRPLPQTPSIFRLALAFPYIKITIIIILLYPTICYANHHNRAPYSCGDIPKICSPSPLEFDRKHCVDHRFNLSCEENRTRTVLYLGLGRYYVQSINYKNRTIRVVDSNVVRGNCFSIPRYSLSLYNFSEDSGTGIVSDVLWPPAGSRSTIALVACENRVINYSSSKLFYIDASPCNIILTSGGRPSYPYYIWGSIYGVGDFTASDLEDGCRIDLMAMTAWPSLTLKGKSGATSCLQIHNAMAFGSELLRSTSSSEIPGYFWFSHFSYKSYRLYGCRDYPRPWPCDQFYILFDWAESHWSYAVALNMFNMQMTGAALIVPQVIAKIIFGIPGVMVLLIYKWRRKHLSMYHNIEEFLQANNYKIMPIRYSYSDIRKMTKGFRDKIGQGGFGSVYKRKLRSGRLVAIKLLDEIKSTNGQDFINEVATIGRIHHVNVVQLLGFCVKHSKRALVYDFMPNGSLDKYIFSEEGINSIDCKKMCEISLGVARGIEYLHQGCNMQILHFDIKPHNILLDENFVPKVSDFGLAILYPLDNSVVSLIAARGTLGYIAPELFYKNIGRVSHKADVYSFGMLLMEMASRRKNLNEAAKDSSEIYYPTYVYDKIIKGKDIEMHDIETEEESTLRKKMMMVALWCIQMNPSNRPPMNRVIKMLDGEVGCPQMPQKPFLYPQDQKLVEESTSTYSSTLSNDDSDEISLSLNQIN